MRAVWIPRYGRPDVLEVREAPDPTPAQGEVRIRVRGSGINFAEIMARQGLYQDAPKPPMVVGYEVSGVIDAVSAGVSDRTEGERVLAMTRFGGYSDTVCVPAIQAFPMPDNMTFEEGAALPVSYLTAYHMLFRVFRLRAGDHVLIHQAAGGVGTAASQLCRSVEGVVSYGTASARKHDYVRENGCDHPIDYHSVDYENVVRELTKGRGVDVVLDALGGTDWKKGYSLLRPAGMLIAFGWANMVKDEKRRMTRVLGQLARMPRWTPVKLMNDNKGIAGINMGHLWGHVEIGTEEIVALLKLYEEGLIKPHVDRTFTFEQAGDAHAYIEAGKNVGKVLLKP
ncbi:MAG: medium chain dehydrogenase/reductase family protein [Myxococcales bacterium]|nr:medium chain dehydrogenase/reductase family protein [Myxococcales bacterium]MDH3845834.1 medium chain dehydrogenase/reductase family protein [Myxococcales bacterium]